MISTTSDSASSWDDMVLHQASRPVPNMLSTTPPSQIVCRCSHGTVIDALVDALAHGPGLVVLVAREALSEHLGKQCGRACWAPSIEELNVLEERLRDCEQSSGICAIMRLGVVPERDTVLVGPSLVHAALGPGQVCAAAVAGVLAEARGSPTPGAVDVLVLKVAGAPRGRQLQKRLRRRGADCGGRRCRGGGRGRRGLGACGCGGRRRRRRRCSCPPHPPGRRKQSAVAVDRTAGGRLQGRVQGEEQAADAEDSPGNRTPPDMARARDRRQRPLLRQRRPAVVQR
eukprot:CAMPEP_0204055742 /NCGR_PEP_ID=MMETSP0360-20130528/131018_1 /ASSEMBLY_ACC=CAM_ASM_000342 /TAXON_ID=268821 /ORGANISM="Scrippsiella Hangoei, Strain SHTV-5" /LENGTH=285 /DNA_ID=CAMNT_0051003111 /DNA_START=194 /DNA_END=1049 /DNA_ORIENTATION=-